MRPQDFYLRTRASRGVRLSMVDPAGNTEWINVRSVMSEEFSAAALAISRTAKEFVDSAEALSREAAKQLRRRRRAGLAAVLVAEWSLPMKTHEEITSLLLINPRLRRQVELASENHTLHFGAAQ